MRCTQCSQVVYVHTHVCMLTRSHTLFTFTYLCAENEFTPVAMGFILVFSLVIFLILWHWETRLPRILVYLLFASSPWCHQTRPPVPPAFQPLSPGDALTLVCPVPSSRATSPSALTLPYPSSIPASGFWTELFRKGKGNHFSHSHLIVYILFF